MESWREIGDSNLQLMQSAIQPRLSLGENFESAMDTTFRIARQRSALYSRSPTYLDIEIVASVLCWWPLKPEPSQAFTQQVTGMRSTFFTTPGIVDSLVAQYANRDFFRLGSFFGPSNVVIPGRAPQTLSELLYLLVFLRADDVVNYLLLNSQETPQREF